MAVIQFQIHSLRLLLAAAPTLLFCYLLIRATYRVTFHPLVRFPGTKLRAISHLPHALSGWYGRQPYDVRELHRKYGPVVRIAPNHLSFITPTSWEDIYGAMLRRSDSTNTATSKCDRMHNLSFSHGFSPRAINDQHTTLNGHIDVLIEKLEKNIKLNDILDMGEWFRFLAFDIIGDYTLNTQFGCVEKENYHPSVALLMDWFRAVSFVTNANAFGQLAPLILLFAPWKALKAVKDHLAMSAQKVHERLAVGDDPNQSDLWTYLLRNKGDKSLTLGEMEVNAALFIIAATEPLSDVLCGTTYFLAQHPDILEKLRKELQTCMGPEKVLSIATTARSPYLQAVINESMRMYAPIPGGQRRKTPKQGHVISGIPVPSDTVVSIYQLSAFTLPQNFALHDRFIPERWLPVDHPDRPKETLSDHQEVFQPFSVGPKNCIGKGLAYAEIKLIMARFIWNFDFELVDDGFAIDKQTAYLFRDRPPLRVRLCPKKD